MTKQQREQLLRHKAQQGCQTLIHADFDHASCCVQPNLSVRMYHARNFPTRVRGQAHAASEGTGWPALKGPPDRRGRPDRCGTIDRCWGAGRSYEWENTHCRVTHRVACGRAAVWLTVLCLRGPCCQRLWSSVGRCRAIGAEQIENSCRKTRFS